MKHIFLLGRCVVLFVSQGHMVFMFVYIYLIQAKTCCMFHAKTLDQGGSELRDEQVSSTWLKLTALLQSRSR